MDNELFNVDKYSLSHMQFFAYKTRPMISGFRLIKFIFIGCLVRVQPDNVLLMFLKVFFRNALHNKFPEVFKPQVIRVMHSY